MSHANIPRSRRFSLDTTVSSIREFGFGANFDPMALFEDGKQGVWYDPSDKSTLFQDVAGTVPVTKDGDPVALMRDKSGNGNHAVQTVSTARPIYKTDGNSHWLNFDGVDDFLLCEQISSVFDDFYIGAATQELVRQNSSIYFMASPTGTVTRIQAHAPYGTGTAYFDTISSTEGRISFRWDEDTGGKAITSHYRNSGTVYVRVNSIERGNIDIADIFTLETLTIGATSSKSNLYNGNIFAVLLLTSDSRNDVNNIEGYLAKKSGVTL